MGGGLVAQQRVRGLEQQLAQGHTAALATGAHVDRGIRVRALQGVHRLLKLGVEVPAVGGVDLGLQLAHLFHQGVEVGVRIGHLLTDFIESGDLLGNRAERHLDVLAHGLGVVQRRLLRQDADRETRVQAGLAVAHGLQAGHDLEQGGLTHAVRAHDADLCAGQEAQGHAMLDMRNNGFIINAMHTREGCYTYIKEIIDGNSVIVLSEEEQEALKRAMDPNGNLKNSDEE